jgi:hypothetical protein
VGAAAVAGAAILALPAVASAHGGGPPVALDHRLRLDAATVALAGVEVRVIDRSSSVEASVADGVRLVVDGALREPLLRIDGGGVFVNAASPTAASDGLVDPGEGWVQVSDGRSYTWHDRRLEGGGDGDRFSIPVAVDGEPAAIAGTFVRVARPALWPWLAGAAAFAAAVWALARSRPERGALTVALGIAAGGAALAATVGFALQGAADGGVARLQLAVGILAAAVLGALLVYLRGVRRVHVAGVIGAIAAAVSVSALPVFWHGVVVSALPADAARLACAVALLAGVAAAVLSFAPEPQPERAA